MVLEQILAYQILKCENHFEKFSKIFGEAGAFFAAQERKQLVLEESDSQMKSYCKLYNSYGKTFLIRRNFIKIEPVVRESLIYFHSIIRVYCQKLSDHVLSVF